MACTEGLCGHGSPAPALLRSSDLSTPTKTTAKPSTYMRFNAAIRTSFCASALYCMRQSILPAVAKGAAP